jgi:hypothetical protein
LTFSDPNGVWPCIDGVSIPFHYEKSTTAVYPYRVYWFSRYNDGSGNFNRHLLCNNAGAYIYHVSGNSCTTETKYYDCNTNVYISGTIQLWDKDIYLEPGSLSACRLSLNLNVTTGYRTRQGVSEPCTPSSCIEYNTDPTFINAGNLSVYGNSLQPMSCVVINTPFEVEPNDCIAVRSGTSSGCMETNYFVGGTLTYGPSGIKTVFATVTE